MKCGKCKAPILVLQKYYKNGRKILCVDCFEELKNETDDDMH